MKERAAHYLLVEGLIKGLAEEDVFPDSAERAPWGLQHADSMACVCQLVSRQQSQPRTTFKYGERKRFCHGSWRELGTSSKGTHAHAQASDLGNVCVGAASMGSARDDVELAEDGFEERRLAHSDGAGNDRERTL